MSDQVPQSPAPAYPPVGSREPHWTTGPGIGFLVAVPGWTIVGLAALTAVIGVATSGGGDDVGAAVGVAMLTAVFGIIVAIPGTIVFNKCKRR
ncbi:MAG: MotA/TolQ/ExbB proton channel family protein [Acidobacteria bacterium]|nr:MotA/TolQ/ExbB proton channel family protein [Acidimicrobiaceae bacterium]MYN66527.1 MotA/TolQ/ExbB proton channel family protein [Acidobacteriota bacterium]